MLSRTVGTRRKVARAVRAAAMDTVQVVPVPVHAPLQPANTDKGPGSAVRVAVVSDGSEYEQVWVVADTASQNARGGATSTLPAAPGSAARSRVRSRRGRELSTI